MNTAASAFSASVRVGERPVVDRVPVPDLCNLWAESPTTPMHLALAAVFEGDRLVDAEGSVDIGRIRSLVVSHLHRTPTLRRVLVRPPVGFGGPLWVDAAGFRIEEHVVVVHPAHGCADEEAFWRWCASRSLVPLDRSRPLWRLDVVTGLPDGRLGVLLVVHHVVADGLRGVAMIGSLLDNAPRPDPERVAAWHPRPGPGLHDLAQDRVAAVLRRRRRRAALAVLAALRSVRREQAVRTPATVLGGPIGRTRAISVIHLPLEALRAHAHALGCTINDLLLAAVTQGLRDLLTRRGECTDGLVLRATAPVGSVNGRRSGMIVVPLPVGNPDPEERLRLVVAETARRKQQPDEGIAGIVAMPRLLARLGVLWARRTASAHVNLYVTNVPGPTTPLYLGEARMKTAVPIAPLVAGVRMSVTAMSYDGALVVTFLADGAVGDLRPLVDGAGEVLNASP